VLYLALEFVNRFVVGEHIGVWWRALRCKMGSEHHVKDAAVRTRMKDATTFDDWQVGFGLAVCFRLRCRRTSYSASFSSSEISCLCHVTLNSV
jgi:hypothetical protein